jgi:hypothetical protein
MFMATFGSVLDFLSIYFREILGYDALQAGAGFLITCRTRKALAATPIAGCCEKLPGSRGTGSPRTEPQQPPPEPCAPRTLLTPFPPFIIGNRIG